MATIGTAKKQDTGYTPAPANAVIDEKVVKKLIGEAAARVDGVLDMKGSLGDFLKADDDPTRGITVSISDEQQATVCIKIITEAGKNIPDIVNSITAGVTAALQNTAGLGVKDIGVEVTDTMTREDFDEKNRPDMVIPTI